MITVISSDGNALIGIVKPSRLTSSGNVYLKLISLTWFLAALIAFAFAAEECSRTATQTAESSESAESAESRYAGPEEYAAYGYANDYAFPTYDPAFGGYDPFFYGYSSSLPYYYPYYYYVHSGRDGDHDRDDGFGGRRFGAGRPPHPEPRVGLLPGRTTPLESTEIGARNFSGDRDGGVGVPSHAFGGGFGSSVHSGGFGSSVHSGGIGEGFHGGSFGGFHGGSFGGGGFGGGFHGGGGGHR
jgi:hypothetical protein